MTKRKQNKIIPLDNKLEKEDPIVFKTQLNYFAGKMRTLLRKDGGTELHGTKWFYKDAINDWLDMYIRRNEELAEKKYLDKVLDDMNIEK